MMKSTDYYSAQFHSLLGGFGSTTGLSKLVADFLGFPESLHHHGVHWRPVFLDGINTSVGVTNTEVSLQVESVLGYPERVSKVGSDNLHALNALLAGERVRLGDDVVLGHGTEVPGLADVLGTVHEEVLDDHEQGSNVVPGQVVLALLLVALQAGAVVGGEVGHDIGRGLLDEESQGVHLSDTLLAVQSGAKAGNRQQEDELQHGGGGGGECLGDTG